MFELWRICRKIEMNEFCEKRDVNPVKMVYTSARESFEEGIKFFFESKFTISPTHIVKSALQ